MVGDAGHVINHSKSICSPLSCWFCPVHRGSKPQVRTQTHHKVLLNQSCVQQWDLAVLLSFSPSSIYLKATRRKASRSKRLLASSLPFNKTAGDKAYLIPTGKICAPNWLDRVRLVLALTFKTLSTLLKAGWGSQARQSYCEKLLRSVCFSHLQIKTNFSTPCRSPGSITHKWKEVSVFPLHPCRLLHILFSAFRVSVL